MCPNQVAQLYSVAEASKNETGGGEGVEVPIAIFFSWKHSIIQKKYTNTQKYTQMPKYLYSQIHYYTNTQVLKNEPYKDVPLLNGKFTEGQYTHKIYHLASKVAFVVFLIIIMVIFIMVIFMILIFFIA